MHISYDIALFGKFIINILQQHNQVGNFVIGIKITVYDTKNYKNCESFSTQIFCCSYMDGIEKKSLT